MSKKLMLAMERADFEINRDSRPITSGGRTQALGNESKMAPRAKERGVSITAIKAAISRRKAAYRASAKK